jgi:IS5 family transposase
MSGNRNDVIGFEQTLDKISIHNGLAGRPKKNPKELYADAIYDSKKIRKYLRNRDIVSNIPVNKRNRKKPKKGCPFSKNIDYSSIRGGVERVFGWLKMRFRKIEIRYEYLASNFQAFFNLAIFLSNFSALKVLR